MSCEYVAIIMPIIDKLIIIIGNIAAMIKIEKSLPSL
jgi:hypothetical protein